MNTCEVAEQLFHDNIKLAYHCLHNNAGMLANMPGYSKEDAAQVCLLGLWRAALTFDASNGNKFSTYAMFAMRREVFHRTREVRRHNPVMEVGLDPDWVRHFSSTDESGRCEHADFMRFFNRLPERTQKIAVWRMMKVPQRTIAENVGVSAVRVNDIMRDASRRCAMACL